MTHGDNCEINLAIFPPWPGRSQPTDVEHKELPFPGAEPQAAAEDAEDAEPGAFTAAEASGDDGDEPMRSGAGTSWIPKIQELPSKLLGHSYELWTKSITWERERDPSEAWVESASKPAFCHKDPILNCRIVVWHGHNFYRFWSSKFQWYGSWIHEVLSSFLRM